MEKILYAKEKVTSYVIWTYGKFKKVIFYFFPLFTQVPTKEIKFIFNFYSFIHSKVPLFHIKTPKKCYSGSSMMELLFQNKKTKKVMLCILQFYYINLLIDVSNYKYKKHI